MRIWNFKAQGLWLIGHKSWSQKNFLKVSVLLGAFAFFQSCQSSHSNSYSQDCIENRGVFDIGSGSTKLRVFKFDHCKDHVLATLFDEFEKVDYEEAYLGSKNKRLNAEIQKQGKKSIRVLLDKSKTHEPVRYVAVMTGTFRKAKNAEKFRSTLERTFKFPFHVLSGKQEAEFGFQAAASSLKADPNTILVWDIGASTMQLSMKNSDKFYSISFPFASVVFKNAITEKVQKKSSQVESPNPISAEQAAKAEKIAAQQAKKLKKKISSWPDWNKKKVIGIGGVHNYSIRGQLDADDKYSRRKLKQVTKKRLGLDDDQIGDKYASTEVSNLLLVSKFMDVLEFEAVHLAKADIREGVLYYDKWWREAAGP